MHHHWFNSVMQRQWRKWAQSTNWNRRIIIHCTKSITKPITKSITKSITNLCQQLDYSNQCC
jgi:hypothetical protein